MKELNRTIEESNWFCSQWGRRIGCAPRTKVKRFLKASSKCRLWWENLVFSLCPSIAPPPAPSPPISSYLKGINFWHCSLFVLTEGSWASGPGSTNLIFSSPSLPLELSQLFYPENQDDACAALAVSVTTQEVKYVESWPNTTSTWAGWSRFDIPVDRSDGVHSLLICTSGTLGSPALHQASQQDYTFWAKYKKADRASTLCTLWSRHDLCRCVREKSIHRSAHALICLSLRPQRMYGSVTASAWPQHEVYEACTYICTYQSWKNDTFTCADPARHSRKLACGDLAL